MLGVQNNNKDEIHMRVNIQNCVKMTVKTFYFPSMRNIIFEVIYQMLLSKEQALTFDQDAIASLVENINLYGMSVEKFRRMLKMMLSKFMLIN